MNKKRFFMKTILSSLLVGSLGSTLMAQEVVHHSKSTRIHAIPLNVIDSRTPVGYLNSQAIFLADQLERNLDKKYFSAPVMVTSFLNLDDLTETSGFGRLLSEGLIHELQVRKWKVIDVRLVKDVVIRQDGEFSLSRDIKNIKDSYNVVGIVTGTYTITDSCVIVNAKVMDIDTGVITSSGQISIPLNGIESLLFSYSRPRAMSIKGDF